MSTTEIESPKSTRKTGAAAVYALRDKLCKWPIGEPGKSGFHFCGKPSLESSPYCNHHYQTSLRT